MHANICDNGLSDMFFGFNGREKSSSVAIFGVYRERKKEEEERR